MIKLSDEIGLVYERIELTDSTCDFDSVHPSTVPVGNEFMLYVKNEITSSLNVSLSEVNSRDQKVARLYLEEGLYALYINSHGYEPGDYAIYLSGVGIIDEKILFFKIVHESKQSS